MQRGIHPERFNNILVLSNGATMKIRTAFPMKVIRFKNDFINDPAVNPLAEGPPIDQDSKIAKFRKRFQNFKL